MNRVHPSYRIYTFRADSMYSGPSSYFVPDERLYFADAYTEKEDHHSLEIF